MERDEPEAVTIRLSVETARSPLRLVKHLTLRRGSPILEIDESLTNLSRHPFEFM